MDEQICAVLRSTGEEKVCCRDEVELDEQETSGGTRINGTTSIGGITDIETDSAFSKCSSM